MGQFDKKIQTSDAKTWWEDDVVERDPDNVAIRDEMGEVVAVMRKEVFAGIMAKKPLMVVRPRI